MTITFLYGFNNYFNRIVKKYDTLSQYKSAVPYYEYSDINFYVNDGVDTTQVINYGSLSGGTYSEGEPNCDYCIVSDTTGILSRWFVMEIKTNRKGQVTYTLHRDVIADNYNAVIDSPCYIQKATLSDSDDLIFNSENMMFNQIKKSESKLHDKFAGVFYYVAYVANPIPLNAGETVKKIVVPASEFDYQTVANPNQFMYGISASADTCVPFYFTENFNLRVGISQQYANFVSYYDVKVSNGVITFDIAPSQITSVSPQILMLKAGTATSSSEFNQISNNIMNKLIEDLNSTTLINYIMEQVSSQLSENTLYATMSEFSAIQNVIGTNIYDNWVYGQTTNDRYFEYYSLETVESNTSGGPVLCQNTTNLALYLNTTARTSCTSLGYEFIQMNGAIYLKTLYVNKYRLLRRDLTDTNTVTIDLSSTLHTKDAPYDILVIPSTMKITVLDTSLGYQNEIKMNYQEQLVKKINEIGTSEGWLYDMQRLPYSSFSQDFIQKNSSKAVKYSTISDRTIFDENATATTAKLMIYYQASKQLTFNINRSIQVKETKIENECDMYRLVSPNGQGVFEFNLAKNGGVDYFNIDCTLRPISPYIHVNPNFKRLYSADYNDYKGLICGGDFSIATVSDRWLQYASQNKYYAQTFNREIENYDFNAKYALLEQGLSSGASAVGTGVGAGMMTGNVGIGLAVGAASVGAGVADLFITQDRIREGKSLKTDLFNYSLRNVQAQPKSLVKTGSDDFNNKIFVTLEYYSCTDVEKEALRNKLKYNGMTVMTIGKISDYIQNEISYIQGQLIRIEGISEDTHMITQIAQEIAKGVYI